MIKLKKTDYVILNGKKFFFDRERLELQCAHCLMVQDRKLVRNEKGLVVGVALDEEDENHSGECAQFEGIKKL